MMNKIKTVMLNNIETIFKIVAIAILPCMMVIGLIHDFNEVYAEPSATTIMVENLVEESDEFVDEIYDYVEWYYDDTQE